MVFADADSMIVDELKCLFIMCLWVCSQLFGIRDMIRCYIMTETWSAVHLFSNFHLNSTNEHRARVLASLASLPPMNSDYLQSLRATPDAERNVLTSDKVESMNAKSMRAELSRHRLDPRGGKNDLQKRLRWYMKKGKRASAKFSKFRNVRTCM